MLMDRLPAVPLIASDPYLSVWMPADDPTAADSIHWSGPTKPIRGAMFVDGKECFFLGRGHGAQCETLGLSVTPTTTCITSAFGGVQLETRFITPALPDDLDRLSMPVTLVDFNLSSTDGKRHDVRLFLFVSDSLCYDGNIRPKMFYDGYRLGNLNVVWHGQAVQKPLGHSGDRICIDWGYLYLASSAPVESCDDGPRMCWSGNVQEPQNVRAVIAYDDIASINYFGDLCKAWYRRNGAQITDAITSTFAQFDDLLARCKALDESILADAGKISPDYQKIVSAAWRQTFAAHKLIAAPDGRMIFLSKENDSGGCIGTADVSYPSIPLFLKYCPELVNAMCRPILEFASMPVWTEDFAPHDVGSYPNATGQMYAATRYAYNPAWAEGKTPAGRDYSIKNGQTFPCYYLYPGSAEVFNPRYQMPVEECGNMLIMLAAAQHFGADKSLAEKYRPLLDKWVRYLLKYGEDPGEQLCTDDFAGHLAHNANLAAKAIVGVACYGRLTGEAKWENAAKEMAGRLLENLGSDGNTPLTLDGKGWSMKYNLLWDKVMSLGLMPEAFYANETRSYLSRLNRYGLPLDSREDCTKSDWACWCAALADDPEVRAAILVPIARMLAESTTRVPFTDWYDTKTGRLIHFIARSVQGGVFAPMLLN